jgi:hypothetical protein
MQANTRHAGKAKVGKSKHGTPVPTYRGLRRSFVPTITYVQIFGFAQMTLMCHSVKGSKKKWVLNWPNVLTVYLVNVGTNFTHEVFGIGGHYYQLQQRHAMSSCCDLARMPNFPIPWSHLRVPPNPNAHATTQFSKTICRNLATPLLKHINKWKSVLHVDGYRV